MSSFELELEKELEKLKKKKKETITQERTSLTTFEDQVSLELESLKNTGKNAGTDTGKYKDFSVSTTEDEEIAPVKSATETKERTWFNSPTAFDDGYQVGDVTKTAVGTTRDAVTNLLTGLVGIGEKAVDAGAYLVGAGAGLFGQDEFQDKMKDFTKGDLYDEKKVAQWLLKDRSMNSAMRRSVEDLEGYSVLGDKSDALLQSAGQLGGTIALQAVGVPWYLTSGVTSFGAEAENAFNQGATYGQAGLSAAISAGAEILTEKLFGGSGFGEKGLINLDGLTKGLSGKLVKKLTDYGIDVVAEGSEEVISEITGNFASALYKEENLVDLLMSEEAIDGYIESFIGGSVLGGGMNVGKVANSIKTGQDYRTGRTADEEAVFAKEVESRIAEQEKDGKKLTKDEKADIEAKVEQDMERGFITTETIEEVLGGDNYKAYQDTIKQESEALAELAELYEGDELKQKAEEFMSNSKRTEMANNLSNSVYEMVKDSRLGESYRDRARRGQRYEADLYKYDEKQRAIVQKAIDSGVLNNSNRTHDMVDFVARVSADTGVSFDFTNNEKLKDSIFAVNGKTVDGYITKDGITINVNSPRYINSIVGHEITHALEGTELYEALESAAFEYAKEKGNYKDVLKAAYDMYSGEDGYQGYEGMKKIKKEAVANLVGDYLFTDKEFVSHLSAKHQNIFQKVWNEVKYMVKIARAGSDEAKKLLEVQKVFEEAYRNAGTAQKNTIQKDGVVYALESKKQPGRLDPRTVTKADVVDMLRKVEEGSISGNTYIPVRIGTPEKLIYWAEKRRGDIIDNNPIAISADKAYNAMTRVGETDSGRAKRLSTDEIVAMIESMNDPQYIVYQGANDRYVEVVKFSTKKGDKAFAVIEIGNNKDSVYMNGYEGGLYNILVTTYPPNSGKLKELLNASSNQVIYDKNKDASQRTSSSNVPSVLNDASFYDDSLPNNDTKVKTQFSLSKDSAGKQLTKEQQEYFKDSKVVDSDGKLLKVYHGTTNNFNTFRQGKADGWGTGIYFTDNKAEASTYGDNVVEAYLNITNPYNADTMNYYDIGAENTKAYRDYDMEVWKKSYEEYDTYEEYKADGQGVDMYDIYAEEVEVFNKILRELGYDGIIADGSNGIDGLEIVAFNENQPKLTSNTKPTADPDIRYSLSDSKKLKDVGLTYDAKNETVSYSLSSLENAFDYNKSEADYLASRLEYETALAKSIAEDKEHVTEEEMGKAKRYLDSLFLIHDLIAADPERLDYEAAVGKSAWVSNVEYGGSIDFSTLCAKRRLFTGTFDAIQNQMPDTVLNENDFLQIRNMLLEKDLESPCSMCYVEGSRAKHGVYVAKFLKEYQQTNPEWMPQIADFTSTTRLEQTRINHPEAYKAYVDAMNKLSQRKPKEASVRTDYRGEILRDFKDTSTVAEKNKNGGVRFNSFSDFEIIHAIDCMQVLTDMARVGLNGQAYTKVKEFAEAFGNTGLKINLSLVAKDVDENGKLIMDETNGMKYAEAMDLRDRYSDNVGTVIVVFNEAQLKAALADNSIDYVLPFHRSQWKKSQYTMMGLPTNTKDFTNFQNDRIKNPNTGRDVKLSKIKHVSEYTNDITGESFEITDNIMPNQYWDFNLDGRGNAQRYLDYINANGMTPKFNFLLEKVDGKWVLPEGAVGDGYFKVLIDFKMYDNDGWGSPQKPVVPEFNMPFIQQMLTDYKGGHQAFPVAHDVVSEFVEGKKSGKFSLSDEDTHPVKYGDYHISGKDVAYEDIAPVDETKVQRKAPVSQTNVVADAENIDPYEDNWQEAFDAITDQDAPPVRETAPVKEISTVADRVKQKIKNTQAELDKNRQLRDQSLKDYDEEIASLQADYDSRKNKNTLAAQGILRRIERLNRLKGDNDANYAKRISDLETRVEKMHSQEYSRAEHRRDKQTGYTEMWKEIIGDTSTWKDMSLGLSYKTKTLRRILRRVVKDGKGNPDFQKADRIYDELETKYDHNEALLKRESQKLKESFAKLRLNHTEDTYAHMLGELRHNPETTLTQDVVDEYYKKHKNKIDTTKVDKAITEARKTFDDLIVRVNEVLKEQGMKEIPYRKGYFPHFTNPKQGWLAKLLNWKTIDTEIPTSIAGLTEAFKPQRSWQSFNKERKSDTTDYSLYQGLDTYIHGALDWIYHIEDLQKRRSLENLIRYTHSKEGIQNKIKEINEGNYDADEAQQMINAVFEEAGNPLSGLVRELMNRTNTLANKKSSMDRGVEDLTKRSVYSTMTNLNNRVTTNMVVGSFSSALTNFIPMVQSWHQVSPVFTVRGLGDFIRSTVKDDGMVAKSDFLTNRLIEEENLYQTGWDKVTDKAAFMMNVFDNITAQTVWRSKYLQNTKEGMSESEAIKDADQFAKNLIAGRSRGNAPTIFDAKNPFAKIFTAFQLEVANQYGYMFEDVPQDSKNKARLVKGYATALMGAHLYNALYSSLVGRDAAFDPIDIIKDLIGDLLDDEEEPEDVILNLTENILDEVPYIGGLMGGGRIPISSALPYSGDQTPFTSMLTDVTEGNWDSFGKELLKPLYYLAMPVGGGQLKKTIEGLGMFSDEHPVAGSYTDSGKLRFPVEDTPLNRIQAGMFGQYASKNARDYFDNERSPLNEKQIQEYIDVDLPIRDYWEYREGLKGLKTLDEKGDYIGGLDLPIDKKNVLINNIADRKDPIDMTHYSSFENFKEFDYGIQNPAKYKFLQEHGLDYEAFEALDSETKEAYTWAFKNPEAYAVSKMVTKSPVKYRRYTKALSEIKADKDKNGKSISGSRKEKVIEYLNNLNADYWQKIILFKSEYPADDTYNNEIVEYLNGMDDITYEEKVTILKELGFTVLADGTVRWD